MSGSFYRLGNPKPEYLAFMLQHYPGWSIERPFELPARAGSN